MKETFSAQQNDESLKSANGEEHEESEYTEESVEESMVETDDHVQEAAANIPGSAA